MATFEELSLPDFGGGTDCPQLEASDYQLRLDALQKRMHSEKIDVVLVYADREHAANMSFLIGFEPRFEEALFLFDSTGNHQLLVGNESLSYVDYFPLKLNAELFANLSLLGQQRQSKKTLRTIFNDFGITTNKKIGCIGWKYFSNHVAQSPSYAIEIPAYLVDLCRDLVGGEHLVINATHLLMENTTGLRNCLNSAKQIAIFEYAAYWTSTTVKNASESIAEGIKEHEIEMHLHGGGLPHSCHPMVSFGDKVKMGLSSPSERQAHYGDPWVIAYGVTGALNCRAGLVAKRGLKLDSQLSSFFDDYCKNYFDVVVAWYESLNLKTTGGEVFSIVDRVRNPKLFEFCVNPGHTLHLDEWVNSPFYRDSNHPLFSGMVLQMDIIPISQGPHCYVNVEDGLVLADEALQNEIKETHPGMFERMCARRKFMKEQLGINLDNCVLPLSNTPGWLTSYILEPNLAMKA